MSSDSTVVGQQWNSTDGTPSTDSSSLFTSKWTLDGKRTDEPSNPWSELSSSQRNSANMAMPGDKNGGMMNLDGSPHLFAAASSSTSTSTSFFSNSMLGLSATNPSGWGEWDTSKQSAYNSPFLGSTHASNSLTSLSLMGLGNQNSLTGFAYGKDKDGLMNVSLGAGMGLDAYSHLPSLGPLTQVSNAELVLIASADSRNTLANMAVDADLTGTFSSTPGTRTHARMLLSLHEPSAKVGKDGEQPIAKYTPAGDSHTVDGIELQGNGAHAEVLSTALERVGKGAEEGVPAGQYKLAFSGSCGVFHEGWVAQCPVDLSDNSIEALLVQHNATSAAKLSLSDVLTVQLRVRDLLPSATTAELQVRAVRSPATAGKPASWTLSRATVFLPVAASVASWGLDSHGSEDNSAQVVLEQLRAMMTQVQGLVHRPSHSEDKKSTQAQVAALELQILQLKQQLEQQQRHNSMATSVAAAPAAAPAATEEHVSHQQREQAHRLSEQVEMLQHWYQKRPARDHAHGQGHVQGGHGRDRFDRRHVEEGVGIGMSTGSMSVDPGMSVCDLGKTQAGSRLLQQALIEYGDALKRAGDAGVPIASEAGPSVALVMQHCKLTPEADIVAHLFEEVFYELPELMSNLFGNYLVQRLLPLLTSEQRQRLIGAIDFCLPMLVCDRQGTRAVQRLIQCCTTNKEKMMILDALRGTDCPSLFDAVRANSAKAGEEEKCEEEDVDVDFDFDIEDVPKSGKNKGSAGSAVATASIPDGCGPWGADGAWDRDYARCAYLKLGSSTGPARNQSASNPNANTASAPSVAVATSASVSLTTAIRHSREAQDSLLRLMRDANGWHVIHMVLDVFPLRLIALAGILDTCYRHVRSLGTDQHGVVLLKKAMSIVPPPVFAQLASKTLYFALELVNNQYGNYLVQHMVERAGGHLERPQQGQCQPPVLAHGEEEMFSDAKTLALAPLTGTATANVNAGNASHRSSMTFGTTASGTSTPAGARTPALGAGSTPASPLLAPSGTNSVTGTPKSKAKHAILSPPASLPACTLAVYTDVSVNVFSALQFQFARLSRQKFSSNVVEKCLRMGAPALRLAIVDEIISDPAAVLVLIQDVCGSFVVQNVLRVALFEQSRELANMIHYHLPVLSRPVRKRWERLLSTAVHQQQHAHTQLQQHQQGQGSVADHSQGGMLEQGPAKRVFPNDFPHPHAHGLPHPHPHAHTHAHAHAHAQTMMSRQASVQMYDVGAGAYSYRDADMDAHSHYPPYPGMAPFFAMYPHPAAHTNAPNNGGYGKSRGGRYHQQAGFAHGGGKRRGDGRDTRVDAREESEQPQQRENDDQEHGNAWVMIHGRDSRPERPNRRQQIHRHAPSNDSAAQSARNDRNGSKGADGNVTRTAQFPTFNSNNGRRQGWRQQK